MYLILAYSTYIGPSPCVVQSLHNFGSTCRLEIHHWLGCSKEPKDARRGEGGWILAHRYLYARHKLLCCILYRMTQDQLEGVSTETLGPLRPTKVPGRSRKNIDPAVASQLGPSTLWSSSLISPMNVMDGLASG